MNQHHAIMIYSGEKMSKILTNNQEHVFLGINISPEKLQAIESLAHRLGYSTLEDYLRALIETDAKAHGEVLDLDDEIDPIVSFRQGWHDAMTGNIRPLSELWDALDEE
jgi:hypothetical protein